MPLIRRFEPCPMINIHFILPIGERHSGAGKTKPARQPRVRGSESAAKSWIAASAERPLQRQCRTSNPLAGYRSAGGKPLFRIDHHRSGNRSAGSVQSVCGMRTGHSLRRYADSPGKGRCLCFLISYTRNPGGSLGRLKTGFCRPWTLNTRRTRWLGVIANSGRTAQSKFHAM
jgi:hypothetical protein